MTQSDLFSAPPAQRNYLFPSLRSCSQGQRGIQEREGQLCTSQQEDHGGREGCEGGTGGVVMVRLKERAVWGHRGTLHF